jgi:hypothetical protein
MQEHKVICTELYVNKDKKEEDAGTQGDLDRAVSLNKTKPYVTTAGSVMLCHMHERDSVREATDTPGKGAKRSLKSRGLSLLSAPIILIVSWNSSLLLQLARGSSCVNGIVSPLKKKRATSSKAVVPGHLIMIS